MGEREIQRERDWEREKYRERMVHTGGAEAQGTARVEIALALAFVPPHALLTGMVAEFLGLFLS